MERERYLKQLQYCAKEKHKIRENTFGVVWCVRCGRLFPNNFASQPLKEEDKIIIEIDKK